MASSSSAHETNVQVTAQQAEGQQERVAYELKGVTMSLKEWQLRIQFVIAIFGCQVIN